jgi:predicted nucleic acid-binding protein
MIVVSDTTPLNYLILIDSAHVLPAIFGRVYAPSAVIKELSHRRSPEAVRTWASSPPAWLTIQDPTHTDPSLKLGVGETAALSLACGLKADRILIDERDGSREAIRSGLTVVGTLGDIEQKIKELKATTFRASEDLYRSVWERVRQHEQDRERDRQAKAKPPKRRKKERQQERDDPAIER